MTHTLFALFDRAADLEAATAELESVGTPAKHCTVIAHQGPLDRLPSSDLADFESGAATMTTRVSLLGAAFGAIFGALAAGPLGLLAAGPLATILLSTTAGTIVGAFAGLIGGATDADPSLKQLAEGLEQGKVLLAVQPPSAACAEQAEVVLHKHHAHVLRRHLLTRLTRAEKDEVGPADKQLGAG